MGTFSIISVIVNAQKLHDLRTRHSPAKQEPQTVREDDGKISVETCMTGDDYMA